ncbi:MAG: hypothetical protein FJ147_05750 [Deltaproteobacteria bacterium]|nr:hypothetical protein [Deltaproteobacteria bacterium]
MVTMNPITESAEEGFAQDKKDYWAMREDLLAKYTGKWVAVHKGQVVAVGDDPLSIMENALAKDGYAYTNKVGEEDRIVIRQRRRSFSYDDTYAPTALPRITATLFHLVPPSLLLNTPAPNVPTYKVVGTSGSIAMVLTK